jgi:hypothetical protein
LIRIAALYGAVSGLPWFLLAAHATVGGLTVAGVNKLMMPLVVWPS